MVGPSVLSCCSAQFNIQLGQGAFKNVFKGFDTERGVEVAWVVDRGVAEDFEPAKSQIRNEIEILKRLAHTNLLELIDWFELSSPSKPLVMITELPSKTLKQ